MEDSSNDVVVCDTNTLVFLSMKTARIKKSRSKRDMFSLENVDSRVTSAHERFSSCRQRGIETRTTKTALREFNKRAVRRIIDQRCGFLNFAHRAHIIGQVLKKRKDVLSKLLPHISFTESELAGVIKEVTDFYSEPDKKEKLEELSRKKRRKSLLPEPNDIRILSECILLKRKESRNITLLTDDGDFTHFTKEIKERFGVGIDRV